MDAALWKRIKEAYAEAIDLPFEEQEAYVADCDPSISDEVARLLAADRGAEDFINRPFLVEHDSIPFEPEATLEGTKIDDYLLQEILGSGGMGTVYLAEHAGDGFTHRVALKLIKRGMDTDVVLRRFFTERQILASLDHPNIARMLDGGSTDKGLPYFVMEYVAGLPIRTYCDVHELDVRSRIDLFTKVCSAVSYAHQKLIVHRDLKPSNILVTENGEPKLLDFGIAKLLSPDWNENAEPMTATQFRILTPEYSSPEQLRGEATSTSTDVYSLGVVLYELLAGVRPFQHENQNPAALSDAIRTRAPRKPSVAALFDDRPASQHPRATAGEEQRATGGSPLPNSNRRRVPDPNTLRGDIDNIVLKALRGDPAHRYQSVRELLDDIERYLSGLPVKATGDARSYRFNKFIKRHWTGVALTGISALLLVAALGIAGYQYSFARFERQRAETQFVNARQFANAVLFDHYSRIKDLPGATEAKAKLVTDAVSYLDAISHDSISDPELLRELAKGYRQLAEIQGITVGSGDLGDLSGAKVSLEKALSIRNKLLAIDPENIEDQRQLAFLLGEIALARDLSIEERADYGRRSFELFEKLRSVNPNKEQGESDYARGLWNLANARRRLGDNEAAVRHFSDAAAIYETLYANGNGNKRFRRSASLTLKNLGTIQRLSGNSEAALASYERALALDLAIASETPDSLESQLALSFSRRGVGEALISLGRFDEAIVSIQEAINLQELVTKTDTSNAFAIDNLFDSYVAMAVAHRDSFRLSSAESLFAKAFGTELRSRRDNADDIRRLYIAKARLEYAQLLASMDGRYVDAGRELTTALSVFETQRERNALDPAFIPDYERALALKSRLGRSLN